MKASSRVLVSNPCNTTRTRNTAIRTVSTARRVVRTTALTTRCCCKSSNVSTTSTGSVISSRRLQKGQVVLNDNDDNDDDNWCRRLGKRWKEYQGIGDWEGMLDPLDHNLRHEILRYGQFVQAAYKCYDFHRSRPNKFPSRRKLLTLCGLPHTGYRITSNLRATCSVSLPSWAGQWGLARSNWIGYVAVCRDKAEMERLGRRDVVIALRGTVTALEWMENLRAGLAPVGPGSDSESAPMVESGFLSLYRSGEPSLQQMVRAEVERLLQSYGAQPPLSVTITGHSMGAALAMLAAYDIMTHFKSLSLSKQVMVTVISFGGPRVGNRSFQCRLEEQLGVKVLRIVNSDDVVTKVPGFVVENDVNARVPSWMVYSEVGKELRLSSGRNAFDVVKCHDLKTYLHLL